ncbi:MAG: maleylpyruvate isomerase family mycothiol-dependent enzyme [Mycobacterium sp.]
MTTRYVNGLAVDYDYLESIEADRRALAGIAADFDLGLRIPGCPDWTLKDLLDHVSGATRWMTKCVAEGDAPQRRVLPAAPEGREELIDWFNQSIDELLTVLSGTPADALVWTPIRGTLGSVWWRRKAALEIAIHRTDAEQALGGAPGTIDPKLALDGIDEYAEEFLPLMLHTVSEPPPVTAVLLLPDDIDDSRTLSLIPAGVGGDPGEPQVEITASACELLLWMWNRLPAGTLSVRGDDTVVTWWKGLAI